MFKRFALLAAPWVVASGISIYLLTRKKKEIDEPERMYRVMFFNHNSCDHHPNKGKECGQRNCFHNHILKIRSYIRDAKSTLDIALLLITLEDVAAEIIKAHQRGVKVRVISDGQMSVTDGSKIGAFKISGIEVRLRESSFFMHHKFVVIDNQLLLTGSLNWTMQGVYGNSESIIICTEVDVVLDYSSEFNLMWESLEKKE